MRSIVVGVWLVLQATAATAGQQRSLWAVVLNGIEQEDSYLATTPEGRWIQVADLREMGLLGLRGQRRTFFGAEHVLLPSLAPDLDASFDERELVLTLAAAPTLFAPTEISILNARPADLEFVSSPSSYLNYQVFWNDTTGYSGAIDAGLSVKGWSLASQGTVPADGAFRRGFTTLTADLRSHRVRVEAGDALARGTSALSGGGVIAGVTVSRNYALDPYYRPFAEPTISGAVTLPSVADLYVNGQLQRQLDLPPGTFSIAGLPVTEGSGAIQVRVRDSLGQVREFRQSYYLATALLAKGQQDFHYAAGFQREDRATGTTYGDWLLSGNHRVGLTNTLTAGAFAEASPDTTAAGLSLGFAVPRAGQFGIEGSASRSRDGVYGSAAAGNWQLVASRLSFSMAGSWRSETYHGLNQAPNDRVRPWNAGLQLSVTLPASIGVFAQAGIEQLIDIELPDYSEDPVPVTIKKNPKFYTGRLPVTIVTQSTVSRWGGGLEFQPLPRTNVRAAGFYLKDVVSGQRSWEGSIGLAWAVGGNVSASIQAYRDKAGDATFVDVNRSLPRGTGVGFRVRGSGSSTSDVQRADAEIEAQNSIGRISVIHARDQSGASSTAARLEGGIVQVGTGVALSRPVSQSFAMVRVPDGPGVVVYRDHDKVGRTGRSGRFLVPNLQAYYGNIVSVEDTDLPLDVLIDRTEATIAPPFRGGATLTFATKKIRAYRGTIRVEPWPADTPRYGTLRLARGAAQASFALGSDGAFYLDNVGPGTYDATIEMGGTDCRMQVTLPAGTTMITTLGELVCRLPTKEDEP